MFIDQSKISVRAGSGGAGCVSFRREKYVAAGGPDGGDGGRGGNVIFKVDDNLSTLYDFRYRRKYQAEDGGRGMPKKCRGKNGADLVIRVPRGTLLKDAATGRIVKDMSDDAPFVAAQGGKGGWGNIHFATPTRQIPRFAKSGAPGQALELALELKLLADVGLLGFPNVGKSTLLSVVSAAKPTVANYPFTTLTPVLGVVDAGGRSFVMADIPGLIEGASRGTGLGDEFLRHVDRCRLLVHVVDASGSEGRDPVEDFETINRELAQYSAELAARPQIVAGNKTDLAGEEAVARLRSYVEGKGFAFYPLCAAAAQGVKELVGAVAAALDRLPPVKRYEAQEAPREDYEQPKERAVRVTAHDGVFFVEGEWLLQVIGSVNFSDSESLAYFQRVLRNSGVIARLEEAGIREGDTVSIYDAEFDYVR